MMAKLPLIYYPTTLYWLDDDELFLEVASDLFERDFHVKKSSSPLETINFFSKYKSILQTSNFIKIRNEDEDYELPNHLPADINLEAIHQIRINQEKSQDIAVLIIDYHMPEMSGIELLKEIGTLPIKKILLTGDGDLQRAVEALNHGIIDYFICKDAPNLDLLLMDSIKALTTLYFLEQSLPLTNHIESDSLLPHSDGNFKVFFENICQSKMISEYYLSHKHGSTLLVDKFKNLHYLCLHTDKTLTSFEESYSGGGHEFSFFINSVKNRTKIPFFGINKNPWEMDVDEWAMCFYEPHLLQGREKYYWRLFQIN